MLGAIGSWYSQCRWVTKGHLGNLDSEKSSMEFLTTHAHYTNFNTHEQISRISLWLEQFRLSQLSRQKFPDSKSACWYSLYFRILLVIRLETQQKVIVMPTTGSIVMRIPKRSVFHRKTSGNSNLDKYALYLPVSRYSTLQEINIFHVTLALHDQIIACNLRQLSCNYIADEKLPM